MDTPLNIMAVTLAGKSGSAYTFAVWLRSTRFYAKGGVFIMARGLGGDQFEMIYIGETADMSKRPLEPSKQAMFKQHGVDHIFSLDEPDARRRAAIVADLVQALNPVGNR